MSNPVVIDAAPGANHAEITREFDAPVEAVFRAHTDPKLFARWIGPRGLSTEVTTWEPHAGGGYAFEQWRDAGARFGFRGVFHTVTENQLIIQTFEYLGAPDEASLDRTRFEALPDGRSRLVGRTVFLSVEALEQMVASGMEHGVVEGYQKLDELLAERQ